jgi:ABC-type ATPase with predicted acetyltransferase domain
MPLVMKSKTVQVAPSKKAKSAELAVLPNSAKRRPSAGSTFSVKSTSVDGSYRRLTVSSDGGRETHLKLPRFALVGPEDKIHVDPVVSSRVSVISKEDPTDLIRVTPHFERRETLQLGALSYDVWVKEITTEQDLKEYEYLEGFHYKTSSSIVSDESPDEKGGMALGGRKVVLLAYIEVGNRKLPAGYIELQMPLMMVKPRHVLFGHGFHHPSRPIAWRKWDVESMRQYVNLIVRVARVVTSPDLRGLGMARILIATAKEYAKERWHIGGRRPIFMEISAEMLKYMDFASSAGLHLIGSTEGNLSRVHKDLTSMARGQKINSGIMTLQKKYLTQLQGLAKERGRSFVEVLEQLGELTSNENEEHLREKLNGLDPQEWFLFRKVLRFPIPYYMCGLDDSSEEFVLAHVQNVAKPEPLKKLRTSARIGLANICVSSTYEIPDSSHARIIRDCFGLNGNTFKVTLVGPVTIEASGGNIILITGPSGSGKSLLLRVLDPSRKDEMLKITYREQGHNLSQAAWMTDIESDKPIIEYFSELWGIERSISALNQAGLSEAFVYLRPYRLLSRGQQYRARLAALSMGSAPVWLMDEFCADLDPFTARIVASNLRKHIVRSGRIAVVAAANNAHYIDALRPTRVIYLRYNGKSEVLSYREYADEFCLGSK